MSRRLLRKLERVRLDSVEPYPDNPRRADLPAIVESLRQNEQFEPIVVQASTRYVLVGNHRVLAARELGWDVVDAVVVDVDDDHARRIALASNRIAELGGYDDDLLAAQLAALSSLDGTGYTERDADELADRLARLHGPAEPPPSLDPPARPKSKPGEVYELGAHRLMCGDATDPAAIATLMGDEAEATVFTSPPYAVGLAYDSYEDTLPNLRALLQALASTWRDRVPDDGGFCVVNFGDVVSGSGHAGADEPCEYPMALEHWPIFREAGWILHTRRIWAKPHARVAAPWTASSNRAASDWEYLWTWKRPGRGLNERRDPSYLGVWDTSRGEGVDVGKDAHPAGFPLLLPMWVLDVYTDRGGAVADPFSGTGSTLIACEQRGRRCFAMEIDPGYADIIRRRYASFVGDESFAP